MTIYGVALLAVCFLIGKLMGNALGYFIDIEGDIGGIGFAMVLLIFSSAYLRRKKWLAEESEKGIEFWSSMFIPIIIAMSATQNVTMAISGGPVALIAGACSAIVCLMLVPIISKIGKPNPD